MHRSTRLAFSGFDFDHSAEPMKKAKRAALVDGFSVHANRTVKKRDRQDLERLCPYGTGLGRLSNALRVKFVPTSLAGGGCAPRYGAIGPTSSGVRGR